MQFWLFIATQTVAAKRRNGSTSFKRPFAAKFLATNTLFVLHEEDYVTASTDINKQILQTHLYTIP